MDPNLRQEAQGPHRLPEQLYQTVLKVLQVKWIRV